MNSIEGQETVKEDINYIQQHISLFQTLPGIITQYPLKTHANGPISGSGCTGHYMDALTTIVNTREPSENPTNLKLPNSSTMPSIHQAQIPLHNLSI